LLDVVEEGRLRWYGHGIRMGEGRIPKRYLQWKPQGRNQASLKILCACECRSETNVPAEKIECNRWPVADLDG